MSEEILVNVTPLETRVAVISQGLLQDVHIERRTHRGLVGNMYQGRVVRVLPGMQAAFLDIGEGRTGFIHLSDIEQPGDNPSQDIRDCLRQGQVLAVQVSKDPVGSKGARLTTRLSLSSRYLVFMPGSSHIGVSQQIDDPDERARLKQLVARAAQAVGFEPNSGFIVRTAAEGVGEEELSADLRFFERLWSAIGRRLSRGSEPGRVYEDWQLYQRALRDLARPGLERIRVDQADVFEQLQDFCRDYVPELESRLEHYSSERPLFDLFGVEEEIERALQRKVDLKSGGYLVIDQTEAMTTIDVNTGAFVGRSNQEDTVYKTNLEAAAALARQLRLRNLAGIIIIDFIDMVDPEHQRQLLRSLERALAQDPVRSKLTGVSELGLVAMTRKRTRDSLEHILCEDCSHCGGRGVLKSAETVCYEIFREILRDTRAYEADTLIVLADQEVVDRLLDEESAAVVELEEATGKTIQFRVEPLYSREQFDIILL